MSEYFDTGTKIRRGRGKAKKSIDLTEQMRIIAAASQPITGRGVGYQLFTIKLITSMSKADMRIVYRLLKEAREQGIIPWEWIVDETREIEQVATWRNPKSFLDAARNSYRRDFWQHQPVRIIVVSEKGTVRGLIRPVTDKYGVGFLPVHGFSSATVAHDLALNDDDRRPLIVIYVGDYDPSGMFMSEQDLPNRMQKYGGVHVVIKRVALVKNADVDDVTGLTSFPASDKKDDPRYKWFVRTYGENCWELDAMDPNALRERVDMAIRAEITDWDAWLRAVMCQKAEEDSLRSFLDGWKGEAPASPAIIVP